jgi:hypothetical protein
MEIALWRKEACVGRQSLQTRKGVDGLWRRLVVVSLLLLLADLLADLSADLLADLLLLCLGLSPRTDGRNEESLCVPFASITRVDDHARAWKRPVRERARRILPPLIRVHCRSPTPPL